MKNSAYFLFSIVFSIMNCAQLENLQNSNSQSLSNTAANTVTGLTCLPGTWKMTNAEGPKNNLETIQINNDNTFLWQQSGDHTTDDTKDAFSQSSGTWSYSGTALTVIIDRSGRTSGVGSSLNNAILNYNNIGTIPITSQQKVIYPSVKCDGSALSLQAQSGGSVTDLTGTFGLLSVNMQERYRNLTGSAWQLDTTEAWSFSLGDCTLTGVCNFKNLQTRRYDEIKLQWLAAVEYKNDVTSTWTATYTENIKNICSYAIDTATKLLTLNMDAGSGCGVAGTAMTIKMNYMISGAYFGPNMYTRQ